MVVRQTRESRNTQSLVLRFRAVLTEGNAQVLFHRGGFDRFGKALA
jgi:hypothetical protein